MATFDKHLAAHRENAKKSAGPRSADGNHRSSQNARKQGITTGKIGLDFIENKVELEAHRNAVLAHYNPQTPAELYWVEQIVVGQWRVAQLVRWESAIFNNAIRESWKENTDQNAADAQDLEQYLIQIDPDEMDSRQNWMLANGMDLLIRKDDSVKTFLNYQSQAYILLRNAEVALAELRSEARYRALSSTSITALPLTDMPQ